MANKNLAIVLVSGGMDSLACIEIAKKEATELAFLHLQYGQNTATKELVCFKKLAEHYNIPGKLQLVVNLESLQKIGGSSLTDKKIEVSDYQGDSNEIPSSYVPFRNAHILATAVSWAEIIKADSIFIGANHEDSPGYPDCRPEYYETFNKLIKVGTKDQNVQVHTPIIHLNKTEILEIILNGNAPIQDTWSCYANSEKACGKCDSCLLRQRGFEEANRSSYQQQDQ